MVFYTKGSSAIKRHGQQQPIVPCGLRRPIYYVCCILKQGVPINRMPMIDTARQTLASQSCFVDTMLAELATRSTKQNGQLGVPELAARAARITRPVQIGMSAPGQSRSLGPHVGQCQLSATAEVGAANPTDSNQSLAADRPDQQAVAS